MKSLVTGLDGGDGAAAGATTRADGGRMHRLLTAVPSVAVVAALALSGCTQREPASPPSATASSPGALASAPVTHAAPLPAPEALTDVLYRLADPGVPGDQKLNLIEGAGPDTAVTLDKFATALRDGKYTPLGFDATDIAWSDVDPTHVVTTVNVTTPNPGTDASSFPMEFRPYLDGWQLSRKTADTLLDFGDAHPGASTTTVGPPR